MFIKITKNLTIPTDEIKLTFIQSRGPGGQNVNKVETGVQLHFDITNSSLPKEVQDRLIKLLGKQVSKAGVLTFKSMRYRTQGRNKDDAYKRLRHFIQLASVAPKLRKKTKPSKASKMKRLVEKKRQSEKKALRHIDVDR